MFNLIKGKFQLMHPSNWKITQRFGENKVDFYEQLGLSGHNGIDYGCPMNTKIYAPCKIEIVDKQTDNSGYGINLVGRSETFTDDKETYRLEMIFAHLLNFADNVKIGKWFEQGEIIAYSNNTGKYTTGSHLHWGVRIVKRTSAGGWQVINRDNGYLGYLDQLPFCDWQLNLSRYNNKLVYVEPQNGAKHYLVQDGQLYWVEDEVVLATTNLLFKDAISIPCNLVSSTQVVSYKIDKSSLWTKSIQQLMRLLAENPRRAAELYNKYFKS